MGQIPAFSLNKNSSERTHWAVDASLTNYSENKNTDYFNLIEEYINSKLQEKVKIEPFVEFKQTSLPKLNKEKIELPLVKNNPFFSYTYYSKVQNWKGTIIELTDKVFIAKLEDLNDNTTYETGEFDIDEVSPSDLKLISIGAVFYWSVGYSMRNGQKTKESFLRFQRLIALDENKIRKANERAEMLFENINWEE